MYQTFYASFTFTFDKKGNTLCFLGVFLYRQQVAHKPSIIKQKSKLSARVEKQTCTNCTYSILAREICHRAYFLLVLYTYKFFS